MIRADASRLLLFNYAITVGCDYVEWAGIGPKNADGKGYFPLPNVLRHEAPHLRASASISRWLRPDRSLRYAMGRIGRAESRTREFS
jgi:hypothetical protein